MARRMIDIKIRGFDELKKKLTPDLYAKAARQILDQTAGAVAATARREAPDSLSDKIVHRVSKRNPPHSAVVRVKKSGVGKRARFIHGSTRFRGKKRTVPHRPPFDPFLKKWAKEAGLPVWLAFKVIEKRGAPLDPFLHRAREAHGRTLEVKSRAAFPLIGRVWSR